MTRITGRIAAAALVMLMMVSCARLGLFHHERTRPSGAVEADSVQKTAQDRENELKALVAGEVESAGKAGDAGRVQVIRRNPYFFKRYDVYPEGTDGLKVTMQEKESRSVPYIADVTVAKQRYTTRLHRKRSEAQQDANFLRDTGSETDTYELRNGKWTRVGSMFVASKSEENVNGEWLPVNETVKRTVAEEEQKARGGWLKRKWASITGQEIDEKPAKETKKKKETKGTPGGSQPSMQRVRRF